MSKHCFGTNRRSKMQSSLKGLSKGYAEMADLPATRSHGAAGKKVCVTGC